MTSRISMPWVKTHTRLLHDYKFRNIPKEIRATYFDLLMLAGLCDSGGSFFRDGEKMSIEEIAWNLQTDKETLEAELDFMRGYGFMVLNGRGWQIAAFADEQGPDGFYTQKCENWKNRKNKQRGNVTSDTNVTPQSVTSDASVTPSVKISQDKIQDKSQESESEDSQSVSKQTDDDVSLTRRKAYICFHAPIPAKYNRLIIANPEISPEDILSELARNYSRKGEGKGKVKSPEIITGINLTANPPEKATIEWMDQLRWHEYLPGALVQKLGLVIQSEDEVSKKFVEVATRIHPVQAKVQRALGRKIG